MEKAEVQAWRRRWREVNAFLREEARATPVPERLRGFAQMLDIGRHWPWKPEQLAAEEAEVNRVRERWAKLRKAFGA
jgi:hypothetical protein